MANAPSWLDWVSETPPAWWEWATGLGTVGAAVFAVWAIQQSRASARDNAELIARERRIDFELGVLKDLSTALETPFNADETAKHVARGLLLLLPVDEFPMCHVRYRLVASDHPAQAEFKRREAALDSKRGAGLLLAREEIDAAVRKRLDERRAA
ncbi:MAG: hypothetical protein ACT4QF_00270 [Sporichthyaceae bacterium]